LRAEGNLYQARARPQGISSRHLAGHNSVRCKEALWGRFFNGAPLRQRIRERYEIVKRAGGLWPGVTASTRRRSLGGRSRVAPRSSNRPNRSRIDRACGGAEGHHRAFREHTLSPLDDFLRACNFARRFKTRKGLTVYECLCKRWTQTADGFRLDPVQSMPEIKPNWLRLGSGSPLTARRA
jgi:hypothetical protein